MKDIKKTKAQLIEELNELRRVVRDHEEHEEYVQTRLKTSIENMPNIYILFSPDGRVLEWNKAAEQVFGYTKAEMIGQFAVDFIVPEEARSLVVNILSQLEKGKTAHYSEKNNNIHKDGRLITCQWHNTPLVDQTGKVFAILSMAEDITEHIRVAEQVKESARLNELLLNSLPHPAMLINNKRIIVAANKIAIDAGAQIGGRCWHDFGRCVSLSEVDRQLIKCELSEHLSSNIHCVFCQLDKMRTTNCAINKPEIKVQDKIWDTWWVPVSDNLFLHYTIDVTERKQMEQKLVRIQRLHAVSELSAGISHNLNNILTGVFIPAQLLRLRISDPELIDDIDNIITAGQRAKDLVHRLHLAVKGHDADQLQAINVEHMIREAVQVTRPKWKAQAEAKGVNIDIVLHLQEDLGIKGTDYGFHDIMTNFIFNSVDAMPHGGTITIRTEQFNDKVVIIIQDDGIGMTSEVCRHIFEPFFTTKMNIGTGLGLSTVYNTVQQWSGDVEVSSTPGRGTVFRMQFPLVQPKVDVLMPSSIITPIRSGRIIIIDDEEAVRKTLYRALDPNHSIVAASNGQTILINFQVDDYDVALIDLSMPGLSGDKIALEMRKRDPAIALGLISGWELSKTDPRRSIFDFYIQKPLIDLNDILTHINEGIILRDKRKEHTDGDQVLCQP